MPDAWIKKQSSIVLKPDLSNILKLAALKLLLGLLVFAIIAVLSYMFGFLNSITFITESFGLKLTEAQVLLYLIIGVFIAGLVVFIVAMFQAETCSYEFFNNKLIVKRPLALVLNYTAEVSFDNVAAVNYSSDSFLDKLFNIGRIELRLSGTEQKTEVLPYVQNAPEIAKWLKGLIDNYNLQKQSILAQQERIESIVDEY
ncbi:hypothetical protein J7L02_02855 [Candidatus Woesearchaeota archaeon]|nr:hypothetical protein [Candidatus Woesearchaeota archaeon]